MSKPQETPYAFGDSSLARERLGIVAAAFEAPSRQLLADLPRIQPRYVVDLGCGPGYASALLRARFPHSEVTGLDASLAMVEEARTRMPGAWFAVADVTAPMRLPIDVGYSRLLLGHLPDPEGALARWVTAMRPPGLLVCEEPVRYRSDEPLFTQYEEAVTAVVGARGGSLWAAPALDADPPGCERLIDRVIEHPVRAGQAAAMFWRNATVWGDEVDGGAELVERLRAVERADPDDVVLWELRQSVWTRRR